MVGEVATGSIGRPLELLESRKAILHVRRVLRFADLAVVEDRNAEVDLPLDDLGNRSAEVLWFHYSEITRVKWAKHMSDLVQRVPDVYGAWEFS